MQVGEAEARIPVQNTTAGVRQYGGVVLPPGAWVEVPLGFMEDFGHDKYLKFDFSRFRDYMAVRDEQGRFTFDWWIPLSMVDGYGRHALSIYRGLRDLGRTLSSVTTAGQLIRTGCRRMSIKLATCPIGVCPRALLRR
jgi:hypothetical protein